jgi:hypothetical protein
VGRRFWLCTLLAAGVVSAAGWLISAALRGDLQSVTERDRRALVDGLKNTPPRPLRDFGCLSPYTLRSNYSVVEVGGPETASREFIEPGTRLLIELQCHTCRPRVMHSAKRRGELNLVDGSGTDLCTSGGGINIRDPATGEQFSIGFKLIGAPGATISWDARQLVSQRNDGETWRQTLAALHQNLEPAALPWDAKTIRVDEHRIETYAAGDPSDVLMSGKRRDMSRLLAFRQAFQDVYAARDPQPVGRVAWMLIDSLLNSATQQDVSRQWVERLKSQQSASAAEITGRL